MSILNVMSCKCRFCGDELKYNNFSNRCGNYSCKNHNTISYHPKVSLVNKSIVSEQFIIFIPDELDKNLSKAHLNINIDYRKKKANIFNYQNAKNQIYDNCYEQFKLITDMNKLVSIVETMLLLS